MLEKEFVVVYDNLYYTRKSPAWGVTFTPKKEHATLFTEKRAKELVKELSDFRGISYQPY